MLQLIPIFHDCTNSIQCFARYPDNRYIGSHSKLQCMWARRVKDFVYKDHSLSESKIFRNKIEKRLLLIFVLKLSSTRFDISSWYIYLWIRLDCVLTNVLPPFGSKLSPKLVCMKSDQYHYSIWIIRRGRKEEIPAQSPGQNECLIGDLENF